MKQNQPKNRRKILIVDDDPDTTTTFKKALMDEGFEQVDTVNDPLLALKNFKAGSYDLLIIDIVIGAKTTSVDDHFRRSNDQTYYLISLTSVLIISKEDLMFMMKTLVCLENRIILF